LKPKPALVARVNDGNGKFPRVPVTIARNGIRMPVEALGRFFAREDIIGFYCRYSLKGKSHIEPLGKDPLAAYTQFLQAEKDVARVREGLLPLNEKPKPPEPREDRSLRTCAAQFKANLVTLGKKKATIAAYSRAVDDLVAQYGDTDISQITEQDMMEHIAFLRAKIAKRTGDAKHTMRNRLRNLTVFFNTFHVKNPLSMQKLAKPMKSRPTRYSIEFINTLLGVATENEKDLIHFFLNTGFRDEEAAFSKYSDIDFKDGTINVHAKPEFDWTPKDGEAREQDIVLQDKFIKRMKARKERTNRKDSDLIFTQETQEKPDMHLIRIVQNVAERAGITGKRITLHAFRRTFGSIVCKQYGIEQARIWLGHSDIETTQRYIAAEEMTTEASRKLVADMFAGVGD
jgi:integrase